MKKIYLILTICLLFLSINVYAKPVKSTTTPKPVATSTTLVASDKRHILLDVNTGVKVITMSDVGSTLKVTELDPTSEEYDEFYGICPITQEFMENPVLCPSGNYYEKSAIIEWIKKFLD